MKQLLTVMLMAVLLTGVLGVAAQGDNPTIISFTTDLSAPLTLEQVEAGQTPMTLAWQTSGVSSPNKVNLEAYQNRMWVTLQSDLPATGNYPLLVQHPQSFGVPTYRLVVVDEQGTLLDQAYVTLAYAPTTEATQIETFTAIANGAAALQVTWSVENRPVTAQVRLVAVDGQGTLTPLALSTSQWVPSWGTVALTPPTTTEASLQLRLAVVDAVSGAVITERNLTASMSGDNLPVIEAFSVEPSEIERGGTVTVTWAVTGASEVVVGPIDPDGFYVRPDTPMAATGSLTYTAFELDYYSADYFIVAVNEAGGTVTATASATVGCPYSYAVSDPTAQDGTCPLAAAVEIPAAHQRYERGEMIWRSDRTEIVALYGNSTYERFPDSFVEGETYEYPSEPPEGYVAPIRGFGKVWVGSQNAQANLGWALEAEIGYSPMVQSIAYGQVGLATSVDYLTLPDGEWVGLYPDGTWRVIE